MNNFDFRIATELSRTETVAATVPDRPGMLRKTVQAITRRGLLEAKVQIANQALLSLVEVLFDYDADGVLANVDPDGRILVPLPWGRSGFRLWGLRYSEMRALNKVVRDRSDSERPLFVWVPDSRVWVLGAGFTKRTATAYVRTFPVTLPEFRAAWTATRTAWAGANLGD